MTLKLKKNVILRRPEKYKMWRKNEIASKKKLKVSIQPSTSQRRLRERWQPLIFVMSKTGRLFSALVLILWDLKTPLLLKSTEGPKKQMHSHLILGIHNTHTHTHTHTQMLIVLKMKITHFRNIWFLKNYYNHNNLLIKYYS